MDEAKKQPDRQGAAMSSKQIGRAAHAGIKIAFHTGVLDISGYVVGSDDFHWLVTSVHPTYGVYTALVHKTCPVVVFTSDLLEHEPEDDRAAIEAIGAGFWEWCGKTYLGLSKKEQ
jgi:hypothetical protein